MDLILWTNFGIRLTTIALCYVDPGVHAIVVI